MINICDDAADDRFSHSEDVLQTKKQPPSVVWTKLRSIDGGSLVQNGNIGICSCLGPGSISLNNEAQ